MLFLTLALPPLGAVAIYQTNRVALQAERNARNSFIGKLPRSGLMMCSSTGGTHDFSDWPPFDQAMKDQKPMIVLNTVAPMSGQSVFVISVPHAGLPDTPDRLVESGFQELVTFNSDGTLLMSRSTIAVALIELPQGCVEIDAQPERNRQMVMGTFYITVLTPT